MIFCFIFLINIFQDPDWKPEEYSVKQTHTKIKIDGVISDEEWGHAPWSNYFVDIEGDLKPLPKYKTKIKMLWDENYFYIVALMDDPHIWAVSTERDSYIWQNEGDFEVFLDPDGDSFDYIEIEINAMGTEWDLLMDKPYSEGGVNDDAWNIEGLKSAVVVNGTLNNPEDVDSNWVVEIAIPWDGIRHTSNVSMPPKPGESWRINFSRVWWNHEVVDGKYVKIGEPFEGHPESNWVWSPQGLINMHIPRLWGFIHFRGEEKRDNRILDFLSR